MTPWTAAHQAPSSWYSPDKNTRVGCHALFQGIFLIQGSNPHFLCLLHWPVGSLSLVPLGKSQSQSVKSLIHVQLFATPWSAHGILQARRLKWAAMPSSRGSSRPRDWTNIFCVSHLVGRFFTTEPTGETQSYRTESYTWRIWCSLWIDTVRTEVNSRTLSWYLITAWIWGRKPTHQNWWPQL